MKPKLRGSLVTTYVTPSELQVWRLIALGNSNKSMATFLGVSQKTIERHRGELCRKLDAHNAANLTRRAVECGVITVRITPLKLVTIGERWVLPP